MSQRKLNIDMRAEDENVDEVAEKERSAAAMPCTEQALVRMQTESEIQKNQQKFQNLNLEGNDYDGAERAPPEEQENKADSASSTSQPPLQQQATAADLIAQDSAQGNAWEGDDMDTDEGEMYNEAPQLNPNLVGPSSDMPAPTLQFHEDVDDEDDLSSSSSEMSRVIHNMDMLMYTKPNNFY